MGISADAGGNRKLIITLVIEAIETPVAGGMADTIRCNRIVIEVIETPAAAGWLDYIKYFRRVIEVLGIPAAAGPFCENWIQFQL